MKLHVISMLKKKLQRAQILNLEPIVKMGLEGSASSWIIPGNNKIINVNKHHQKLSTRMKCE